MKQVQTLLSFYAGTVGQADAPKHLILVVTLLSVPVFQSSSLAANSLIGSAAPYFRVQSGDDNEVTLDTTKGKVAAIFYENKDIVGANQRLKEELKTMYDEQTDTTPHYRLFGGNVAVHKDMEKKTQGILQKRGRAHLL